MNKTILITGTILGLTGVLLGAFGTHGLKTMLAPDALQSFETGVRYQIYHALLLLFVGNTSFPGTGRKKVIYFLILAGVILFSGSVYGLSTNDLSAFNFKKTGFITPIGGTLLIAAWGLLCWSMIRSKIKT